MIIIEEPKVRIREYRPTEMYKIAAHVFKSLKLSGNAIVELEFVSENEIKTLNKEFRAKDTVTDVLSFPLLDLDYKAKRYKKFSKRNYPYDCDENGAVKIGSIIICDSFVRSEAAELRLSPIKEFKRLFLHGLLHLLGFDHVLDEDYQVMEEMEEKIIKQTLGVKSGFITVVGKPNSGKSSLVNALIGQKISIVSPRAQTTRDKIMGVLTESGYQMIFVDTPGIHPSKNMLDKRMQSEVNKASEHADAIIFVYDGLKNPSKADLKLIDRYLDIAPVFIALNKIDLYGYDRVYPLLKIFNEHSDRYKDIIPISAKTGRNVELLKELLQAILTDETQYFNEEDLSDKPLSFMVREVIREKSLLLLNDEIPHGIAIMLQTMKQTDGLTIIEADIVCERESHKRIIIGEDGSKLKEIGTAARKELEKLLGMRVFLRLFVKVREDWRNRNNIIRDVGYDN